MTTPFIITYSLLLILGLALVAGIRSRLLTTGAGSNLHYGLLICFALQGLASMLMGMHDIRLSWNTLNLASLAIVSALGMTWLWLRKSRPFSGERPWADKSAHVDGFVSFSFAFVAGCLFYTLDFIPSALSGDPARHFMGLIDPGDMKIATIHKPVYYVMGGLFVHSFPWLEKDQLFVLFNIFVLGLSTRSCLLLFRNLFPASALLATTAIAAMVSFGYSFFILQYGGYTLVLSSAFLFSAMALLVEYRNAMDRPAYSLVTLLVVGVVLTHSYLAPDALLILLGFSWWNAHRLKAKISSELWQRLPFWMAIAIVAVASNLGLMGVEAFARVVVVQAYVNESFYIDLLPFLPLAGIYFVLHRRSEAAQLMSIFTAGTAMFSLYMLALHSYGASTYYLNRNQIVLLPLLTMACVAMIQTMKQRQPLVANALLALAIVTVSLPYVLVKNTPLSISEKKLKDLLDVNQLVYVQNVINTSLSPLQMTQKDRQLMRDIGAGKSTCMSGSPNQHAALDTDLEVLWFELYTRRPIFMIQRNSRVMLEKGFFNNYKEWLSDLNHTHIVIFRNFDLWGFPEIRDDIKSRFVLACQTDSIEIYRRPVKPNAAPA